MTLTLTQIIEKINAEYRERPDSWKYKIFLYDPKDHPEESETIACEIDAIPREANFEQRFNTFYEIFYRYFRNEYHVVGTHEFSLPIEVLEPMEKDRFKSWGVPLSEFVKGKYHDILAKEYVLNEAMVAYFTQQKLKSIKEVQGIRGLINNKPRDSRKGEQIHTTLCHLQGNLMPSYVPNIEE